MNRPVNHALVEELLADENLSIQGNSTPSGLQRFFRENDRPQAIR
jgi:hypothetical protein